MADAFLAFDPDGQPDDGDAGLAASGGPGRSASGTPAVTAVEGVDLPERDG